MNATVASAPALRRGISVGLRAAVVVPLLLVVLAGAVRLVGLTTPAGPYWDENYYAFDAYAYAGGMLPNPGRPLPPAPTIYADATWMHPPLGKLLIATGVAPTSFSDLGMRLPSAIFGIAGVLLVYAIAMTLWGSIRWAGLAGLFVAVDGMHIVHSRMAMLDIFLSTFVLAGVLALLLDRRKIRAGYARADTRLERWFGTKERFWAGFMFGAAAAVKWNGAAPLLLAAVFTWVWLRESGANSRRSRRTVLLAFVAVPLVLYLASYWQFFVQHPVDLPGWLRLQWYMARNHLGGHADVPTTSHAWTWPVLWHPIRYWVSPTADGRGDPTNGIVLALGNPVVFWGFLVALPLGVWHAIRSRESELRIVLGFYAVLILPWLLTTRNQYIYYILPCVPFMALAIVGVVRTLPRQWARRTGISIAVLACAVAILFAPVWLGIPTSNEWLAAVRWLPRWH